MPKLKNLVVPVFFLILIILSYGLVITVSAKKTSNKLYYKTEVVRKEMSRREINSANLKNKIAPNTTYYKKYVINRRYYTTPFGIKTEDDTLRNEIISVKQK